MHFVKKLVLGVGVLGVFVLYSLGIRHEQPRVGKPASLAKNSAANTASNTTATTSESSGDSTSAPSGSSTSTSTSQYRDGMYTGSVADAYYGSVQVEATISGGKLTGIKFLQYPDTHQTSVYINQQAMPYLEQEAIQAQSSHVNVITGATFTSQAFTQSLAAALAQA